MALETATIRRHLLGDANQAQHEEFVMNISEEDFERDIAIAENELIEDYLEGALPAEERELFEKHYLSSDEHRDLVNELALLKRYSSGPAEVYLTGEVRAATEGLSQYRQLAAAAAIVLVGVLGLLSWRMFQAGQHPTLRQEYVRLNNEDLSDLSQYPSMKLVPALDVRQASEPRFRTDGPGTSFMFRAPVSGDGPYDATLSMNGTEVLRVGGLRTYLDGESREVRLLVPRDAIGRGQAEIVLTGGGETIAYPFIAD
jgi:hypothetical protein